MARQIYFTHFEPSQSKGGAKTVIRRENKKLSAQTIMYNNTIHVSMVQVEVRTNQTDLTKVRIDHRKCPN